MAKSERMSKQSEIEIFCHKALIIVKKEDRLEILFAISQNYRYLCSVISTVYLRNSLRLTAKLQNNMQNTKEIQSQNRYLVRRVSLTDSLKSIPAGVTVTYDCREAGSLHGT